MKSSTLHVNGCVVGRSTSVHVKVRRGLHEFGFHHRIDFVFFGLVSVEIALSS